MERYSQSIDKIKPYYQVVVIGSGYGGGVSASRLSRAGLQVCVLERGKEICPGEFPENEIEALREMNLYTPKKRLGVSTGLYNFHINDDITVITGCGLGGTSLINANVVIQPETRVFEDPIWPSNFRKDLETLFANGFACAKQMLKPTPFPYNYPKLKKLDALENSASYMGVENKFYRPEIAVNFEEFDEGVNHVGAKQNPCVNCGDCVSGCNFAAKNTIAMNYIPDAHNFGAEIFTHASVSHIEKKDNYYLIYYYPLNEGRELFTSDPLFIKADIVILSAGTLGSTEILLRSKAKGLQLSNQVGNRFSGNGDVLGFGYNTDTEINGVGFGRSNSTMTGPVGPTITGIIDLRNQSSLEEGVVIEEGALPSPISNMLPKAFAIASETVMMDENKPINELLQESQREFQSKIQGSYSGAVQNTQTYLVMSHNDSFGKMYLKDGDGPLRISWKGVGNEPIFRKVNALLKEATKALKGGLHLKNPFWRKMFHNHVVTVHPLGGCYMGDKAENGVVNHKGQVFSSTSGEEVHKGLYVMDGSVIPRSLGVNPLLTITAISERNIYLLSKDYNLKIDYDAPSIQQKPNRNEAKPLGLQFTETMKGYFSVKIKNDYQKGFERGKNEQSTFQFTFTIHIDDLNKMLNSQQHQARITGSINAPTLSKKPIAVTNGYFNLFIIDPMNPETRKMNYRVQFTTAENEIYFLEGFKTIHNDDFGFDMWRDTTTLYITLRKGHDCQAPVLGKGILHIQREDFMKQLRTIRILNEKNRNQQLKEISKFGKFFAGSLFEIYGGVVDYNHISTLEVPPRKKRVLRTSAPKIYYFKTNDNVELRLTRYLGGTKGPILLIHGFGVSSSIYTLDTIETNLTEYLFAHGYDVWLLDWRASIALPYHHKQFTVDDVAINDIPSGVEKVREITGAKSIDIITHCVGALAFLMSMMNGLEGIRSVVVSQVGTHLFPPKMSKIKTNLCLSTILKHVGVKELKAYPGFNPKWHSRLFDVALRVYPLPYGEQCQSIICHRASFMYGLLYQHDQLNNLTHETLYELLGGANITAFDQLSLMFRKGQIVNADGIDVYLPNLERLDVPITFIHGEKNNVYLPKSTEITYQILCRKNKDISYNRHVIPNYGHIDCIIGKNAVKDVYPLILSHLQKSLL
ncbi:GMC oxidoreductase [Priestia megaterium]|uniref:GMC oxidoreductase n=1 Tax=Priestia megaterium TaxID=1404 RepID=UPI002E1AD45D|nr:GMC oxidoreductase [Priestia megaterium]MED4286452.1 GMC oxidoreductase [Priestia megaterium]